MKKQNLIYFLFLLVFSSMLIIAACSKEGPAGPPGKDGTNGTNGLNGENGIDGKDGTAGCITCHDATQALESRVTQWEASVHATGGNFERNTTDCAPCHTSQGFVERIGTGADTTVADIDNPNPQNCYTCHKIHETYTAADLDLRVGSGDAVTFIVNGESHEFGDGNLCASCHQARVPSPYPSATAVAGDSVTIGSPYWGLHHGPQANMLAGTGAVEIAGSVSYTNSAHTGIVTDACVTCHMATAYGAQAGGHTMNMTYLYHGSARSNTAGCVACHSDASTLTAKVANSKTAVDDAMALLRTALIAHGVFDDASGHPKVMKMEEIEAAAVLNYLFVEEDRSEGVHNTDYAVALLTNSLEALNAL